MKNAMDIMTKEVISLSPDASVTELAHVLTKHNIGGVPVVDVDGFLLGVVTESDLIDQKKKVHIPTVVTILDSVFYLENPDRMEKEMKKIAGATVGDIYTKDPITIDEETMLDEIATIMAEKGVHTLPVLREGKLVGVIGKKDIIKTLIT